MTTVIKISPNLEEFLKLPETEPACEYINKKIIQKLIPQGEHSRLQAKLCNLINQIVETPKIAYAFPDLRCTFGGASLLPDVAVFRWERISFLPSGRIVNRFEIYPDWAIEILSPEQSQTKVLAKLLACSPQGTELGWLVIPEEESILAVFPGQRVELYEGGNNWPILNGIELELTVETVFSWLSFS
ncbi:Uma2 family endonuclease [Microcoleus vaginatus GB1-A2]|uniref:Uma2 family endonuclease n=1 Tax=Microcoleus vaginatus TaxID=119532 RepID=UPI001681E3F7|nr:Uma2 family endonuclease [Microcoleus sp. FACHB-61]